METLRHKTSAVVLSMTLGSLASRSTDREGRPRLDPEVTEGIPSINVGDAAEEEYNGILRRRCSNAREKPSKARLQSVESCANSPMNGSRCTVKLSVLCESCFDKILIFSVRFMSKTLYQIRSLT